MIILWLDFKRITTHKQFFSNDVLMYLVECNGKNQFLQVLLYTVIGFEKNDWKKSAYKLYY